MARKRRDLDVAQLLALRLPDDWEALRSLTIPEASALSDAGVRELREASGHFGALLVQLARDDLGSEEWFWEVLHFVAVYFGFCLYEYALKSRPASALELMREVEDELTREAVATASLEAKIQRSQVEELLGSFCFCASNLLLAADIDEMEVQLGELTEKYDADLTATTALETFHEEVEGFDAEPLEVADSLLAHSFRFRRLTVQKRFKRWRKSRESWPFVGVKELSMLSERAEEMVETYKEKGKSIERTFEQKLWVIFQALGFFVASARPGEAAADLLCISRPSVEPGKRYSFLVEAKTSRNPYKLPKDDWRAISDYVRDVPESVLENPPLSFVLLVGSEAAETMPKRLVDLEDELGIPIRFGGANLIAVLHHVLAAPVAPQMFREAVRNSPHVLSEAFVKDLSAKREQALAKMSEDVRNARRFEF